MIYFHLLFISLLIIRCEHAQCVQCGLATCLLDCQAGYAPFFFFFSSFGSLQSESRKMEGAVRVGSSATASSSSTSTTTTTNSSKLCLTYLFPSPSSLIFCLEASLMVITSLDYVATFRKVVGNVGNSILIKGRGR